MNSQVAFYLHTDPYYERFENMLRLKGFSVSPISMDEFESTASLGYYRVHRNLRTALNSIFHLALDKEHRIGLVTAEVPMGYTPPLTSEQVQLQDLSRRNSR